MLDNIYNKKYEIFTLEDGTEYTSKDINWRCIEWERVIKITVINREKTYVFDKKDSEGFINCRYGGYEKEWFNKEDLKKFRWKIIHIWVIGLIYDNRVKITEIDFKTGEILNEVWEPLSKFKPHIHPRLNKKEN